MCHDDPRPAWCDREWTLCAVGGDQVGDRPPTLTLTADGSFAGFAGVNRMFGRYELAHGTISFGAAGTTLMAGPAEAMQLEGRYLAALGRGGAFRLEGSTLTIGDGPDRLVFEAPEVEPDESQRAVTGTVAYRERIAMPPGALLTIALLDVSRADAPADTISLLEVDEPGNVPIDFELPYDPTVIDDRHTYSVRATIHVEGHLWFTSTDAYLVITADRPTDVDIVLRRPGVAE